MATSVERAQAARSALWSLSENAGLAGLSFLSLVFYSRFLSAGDFGLFSIVLALIELLAVLVNMLFHDALVQKPKLGPLHFDTAFTVSLALGVALFGACTLFAPVFSRWVDSPAAADVLRVSALSLPCGALSATIVAQQRRELDFRSLALRSIVGRAGGAIAGIALVVFGARFWGLVAQQVLIAALGSVVLWLFASARPRLRFGTRELRELLGFGAYSIGSLFLSFAVKRLFTILSGVTLGTEAAGLLNLSFRAVDVLWAIAATAVTQVALPIFSRLQADRERLARAYHSALKLTCLALYPCFVGMAVTAPEIIEALFGAKWLPASPYLSALALLVLLQAPRLLITPALTAIGRPRDALVGVTVELLTVLAGFAVLRASSLPLVLAIWLGRELLAAPVMASRLNRATGIGVGEQLRCALAPLAAALTMALGVHLLRRALPLDLPALPRLLVLSSTGALLFVAAIYAVDRGALSRAWEFAQAALERSRKRALAISGS